MESNAELRDELRAAIAKVQGQIAHQRTGPNLTYGAIGPSGGDRVLQELEAELAQLKEALEGLGPDDT